MALQIYFLINRAWQCSCKHILILLLDRSVLFSIHGWPTPLKRSKCLLQGDDIGRKLRDNALFNSLIDFKAIGWRLDAIVTNDVHLVVEVKEAVDCAEDDAGGADAGLVYRLAVHFGK